MAGAVNQSAGLPPLGRLIREYRLRVGGLTLAELGTKVGYSASTISRLERGKQKLQNIVVLRALAEALDIPLELVGLAEKSPPGPRWVEQNPHTSHQGFAQVDAVPADAALQQPGDNGQLGEAPGPAAQHVGELRAPQHSRSSGGSICLRTVQTACMSCKSGCVTGRSSRRLPTIGRPSALIGPSGAGGVARSDTSGEGEQE